MNKLVMGIFLCIGLNLFGSSREEYLKFLVAHEKNLGGKGDFREGQIEIITDPKRIKEIEELQKKRLLKKGMSEKLAGEASSVGIIAEDGYWLLVRDAVVFPTGAEGTYNRMIWKTSLEGGIPGVAVLPVLPNGEVVLIVTYRHATRAWELEIPRGGKKKGEDMITTMKRELLEETGYQSNGQEFLGMVAQDSGSLSSVVPVFFARVEKLGSVDLDYFEAIAKTVSFPLSKMNEIIRNGSVEIEIKGKKEKVFVRDSFLTYALYLAEIRGLLNPVPKDGVAT